MEALIYVSKDIQFHTINLDQFNSEKDIEICALRLSLASSSYTIICIYRSPSGDFNYFLNQLETVLNKLHKVSTKLIVCGDFNVNHFKDNSRKLLLDSLFASYSLFSTVSFPTRISNNSSTLIDNIYINTYSNDFSVQPFMNGLSVYDAQIITFTKIFILYPDKYPPTIGKLTVTQHTILHLC